MATTIEHLHDTIDEMMPGVIADRRWLHQHPELGYEEHKTAAFITNRLQAMGVEDIRTGIGGTGITGLIHGGRGPGRVVGLRADMDALPIEEEADIAFRSETPRLNQ